MDGIINILKPPGMTSFDVVAYLRGVLKTRKIGHTGTLDPGAVGVLPVCIGTATKAIEYITDKDKLYRAELTLGISTDTQDAYGEIVSACNGEVSEEHVKEVMKYFLGGYKQIPPMYSAVKINGKKLYELARQGVEVRRKPRDVKIHSIKIINIKKQTEKNPSGLTVTKVIFDVACSKGTYIRTLCHDIGEKLGCGGHMSFLVRMGAGNFRISSAVTLEDIYEIKQNGRVEEIITGVDRVFENFDKITLSEEKEKKFLNGVFIKCDGKGLEPEKVLRVYSRKGKFIALGEVISRDNLLFLKSKKRF